MASYRNFEESSSQSSDSDESLDPLSPHFDPMKALYAKSVKLPVPTAKQFNNVAEFENYMKGKDAKTLNKNKAKPNFPGIVAQRAEEQARERVRKAAIMAKSQGPSERSQTQLRRQRNTTVFTRMETFDKGPLSLLKRSVEERLRVVVVVRAAVAIRSRCRGYVIAFDKHFNMGLMDVDELMLKPVKEEKDSSKGTQPDVAAGVEVPSGTRSSVSSIGDQQSISQLADSITEKLSSLRHTHLHRQDTQHIKAGASNTERQPGLYRHRQDTQHIKTGASNTERQTEKGSLKCFKSTKSRKEQGQSGERKGGASLEQNSSASHKFMNVYKTWAEQRCYTKYEIVERHVNQLFLRGDNVVSVILDQT